MHMRTYVCSTLREPDTHVPVSSRRPVSYLASVSGLCRFPGEAPKVRSFHTGSL